MFGEADELSGEHSEHRRGDGRHRGEQPLGIEDLVVELARQQQPVDVAHDRSLHRIDVGARRSVGSGD